MRELGKTELPWHIASQKGTVTVLRYFEITGPFSRKAIQAGLDFLVDKYPILNTHIEEERGKAVFKKNKQPLTVTFLPREELASPRDALEEDLNESYFQDGRLFFLKAYFSQEEKESWELILGAHHAIIDGGSANLFVFEFLEFLQCYTEGIPPSPQLKARHFPLKSPDALISPKYWKQGSRVRFFLKQLLGESIQGKILPKVIKEKERRTQIHYLHFNREATREIVRRSKEEKTTVQGAITAAFLHATKSYFARKDPEIKRVKYLTIMSLRPFTEGKGAGFFGCFASNAFAHRKLSQLQPFWEEARQAKQKNDSFMGKGYPFIQLDNIERLLHIASKLNKRDIATFTLSNVGLVKAPQHLWKYKLKNVLMAASINSFGAGISTGIQTINGKLTISLYYLTRYFNRVSIAEFAEVLEAVMLEAVKVKGYEGKPLPSSKDKGSVSGQSPATS